MLLIQEAEQLSLDDTRLGIVEEIVTEDDLYTVMSFMQSNAGRAHTYFREGALPTSNFRSVNEDITEGTGEVDPVTLYIKAIIDDTDVDEFLQTTMSDQMDQTSVQLGLRGKATGRKFRNALVNGGVAAPSLPVGSGNPAGFITALPSASFSVGKGYGIIRLDVSADTVEFQAPGDRGFGAAVDYSAGGTFTLYSASRHRWVSVTILETADGASDALISVLFTDSNEFAGLFNLVDPAKRIYAHASNPVAEGALGWGRLDELGDALKGFGSAFYLCAERTIRSYKTLLRTAGGVDSAMLQLENFGRPVLTLDSSPILKNEFIPTNIGAGSTSTSMFAIKTGDQGLTGIYAGNTAGIDVQEVGIVQNRDARRWRVKMYASLALYSSQALVELYNISN